MNACLKRYALRSPALLLLLATMCLLPQMLSAATNLPATPLILPADFDSLRDPLLPPGFQQLDNAELAEQDRLREQAALAERIQWPTLKLRGITHAGRSFIAVLEDVGIVEEGDVIRLRRDDFVYSWRVDAISDNGIATTRLHVVAAQAPSLPIPTPPQNAPQNRAAPQVPAGLPLPFP